MAIVDKESTTNNHLRDSSYQEAEKLLKLAEDLETKCQNWERQLIFYIMRAAAVLVMSGSILFVLCTLMGRLLYENNLIWLLVAIVFFVAVCVVCVGYYTWQITRRHLRRDQRALFEIVGILREVESAIAQQAELSALERAEFRIRLSRFDIGPADYSSRAW